MSRERNVPVIVYLAKKLRNKSKNKTKIQKTKSKNSIKLKLIEPNYFIKD